jgi:DNA-binding winged helix-turn-helix (wHTH) protein/Flp pilus assembly protein TadD
MGVRIVFPPFSFDRDERVLRRDGRSVPLAPKVAEALALLLAQPGALVEKNALRDALWPEGFVEDGNLTQTIYLIRRALDPDGDGRAFVETVPRRGYRFVAPADIESGTAPASASKRTTTRRVAFACAAAAVVLVASAAGDTSTGRGSSPARAALTGEAARAYAVGRYDWNRRTEPMVRASMTEFGRVIALAPNDARGYAGLADAYVTVGDWDYAKIASRDVAFRKAERYAREALRRDPHSGEALTSLGWIALDRDRDLERTQRMLREAIAERPDHAPAYEFMGVARLYLGDAEGARTALRHATELDPLSPIDLIWYGKSLYYGSHFVEARTAFRQVLDLDPANVDARWLLALSDLESGRVGEARRLIASLPSHKRGYKNAIIAIADARTGRTPGPLPDLTPREDAVGIDKTTTAALCLALGRRDDALGWLRLSMRDPEAHASRKMLAIDPLLKALRDDARFRALIS